MTENLADWKAVYDSPEPHRCTLPYPWHDQLDSFQRMIVLRAIRPDKVRGDVMLADLIAPCRNRE
jgi:dynein heavy chain